MISPRPDHTYLHALLAAGARILIYLFIYLFIYLLTYLFKKFIYFERGRGRESALTSGGKAERERESARIPSRLHTVNAEPDVGLKLMTHEIMT